MAPLTKEQPETLLALVAFANANAGYLPTARKLAEILRIDVRAASARLKRIVEDAAPDAFVQDGRMRKLNYDTLCTERETASALISIHRSCATKSDGRIPKVEVINILKLQDNQEKARGFVEVLCRTGYLQEVEVSRDEVRQGPKLYDQLEYLRRLSES